MFGSPAHKYKLVPKNWIVEINGQPVPDIAGFLRLISKIKHGASCRVKTVCLEGRVSS
jgi:S1-C subfamily serine protease